MAVIAEFEIAAREAANDGTPPAEPDQFRFGGRLFTVADDVSTLPMMRYAASLGGNVATTYAAAYNLLQHVVAPTDWAAFEAHATALHATYRELIDVAHTVYNHLIGRPTRPSSGSTGGRPTTGDESSPGSSSPATLRPDLAVPMVAVADL
jgi:hypothetical protein